jgi:hypothetical protein
MMLLGEHMCKYNSRVPSLKFVLGVLHTEAGAEKAERRRPARNR